jgi:hypothetical protein
MKLPKRFGFGIFRPNKTCPEKARRQDRDGGAAECRPKSKEEDNADGAL